MSPSVDLAQWSLLLRQAYVIESLGTSASGNQIHL